MVNYCKNSLLMSFIVIIQKNENIIVYVLFMSSSMSNAQINKLFNSFIKPNRN